MRLLNDELAKNILEASKKEFLEKGFQKASLRSIAAAVNVTDAFKLIACCSEGTKYADYVERLIEIETKSSIKLIQLMQADGKISPDFDEQLVHIISSTMFNGVFEIISHNEPIEKAREHIHILKEFYTAG